MKIAVLLILIFPLGFACHDKADVSTIKLPDIPQGQTGARPPPESAEVQRLRGELDSMQATLDQIRGEPRPEEAGIVTPESPEPGAPEVGGEIPVAPEEGEPEGPGTGEREIPPPEEPEEGTPGIRTVAPRSQPRSVLPPQECVADKGLIRNPNNAIRCICDASRHFHLPPAGYPQEDSAGRPYCVRNIEGIELGIIVGPLEDDGTDSPGKLRFLLCKEPVANVSLANSDICFSVLFPPTITLNRGEFRPIYLESSQYPALRDKIYPDDAQYFYITSNGTNTDRLHLAGVSLQVKLEGATSYEYIYRNGCVNRYIEQEGGHNWYAPFNRTRDDAWCFYIETPGISTQGTDSAVSIRIPLSGSLSSEAVRWITSYNPSEGPRIVSTPLTDPIRIALDYPSYDDFGHDHDPGFFAGRGAAGARTLYGVTVYDGQYRTGDQYQINIGGSDAWRPDLIKVVHFLPGTRNFLDRNICTFDESSPGVWLSTDPSDGGGRAVSSWPSSGGGFQRLRTGSCPVFEEGFTRPDY